MAKQTINLGTPPAGADGDTVRTAFSKAEANFAEIYSAAGSAANSKALNGLTGAADRLPYFTGAGALSLATLTAYARTLIDDPDAATARTTLGLGAGSSPTFTALTLNNGQIVFPATQVPSANANTLDDYEEGTWTPTLTFATPGDLNVVYSTRSGKYTKIGEVVALTFIVVTSTFTHTTASGGCQVTGLPFPLSSTSYNAIVWAGITKANYTSIGLQAFSGTTTLDFFASGSGQSLSAVTAANMPSGGAVQLRGTTTVTGG